VSAYEQQIAGQDKLGNSAVCRPNHCGILLTRGKSN